MKDWKWFAILATALIASSAVTYTAQILIFHRPEETFYLLFQDLAFLPISVLIVALIIDKLLKHVERQSMFRKLSIVIGVFFSEVGVKMLEKMSAFDSTDQELKKILKIGLKWTDADFAEAQAKVKNFHFSIDARKGDLEGLRICSAEKRPILLTLMKNPNLLEHDSFTDMLLAVAHLTEELGARDSVAGLPGQDLDHLSLDIKRAYTGLLFEWLAYMNHLKREYPYLYSLAVRTNPYNPEAEVKITQ